MVRRTRRTSCKRYIPFTQGEFHAVCLLGEIKEWCDLLNLLFAGESIDLLEGNNERISLYYGTIAIIERKKENV